MMILRVLAVALCVTMCLTASCAWFQANPKTTEIAIDCGIPAVAVEAQNLSAAVAAIVNSQAPDWQSQLTALEKVSANGVACALEHLAVDAIATATSPKTAATAPPASTPQAPGAWAGTATKDGLVKAQQHIAARHWTFLRAAGKK